LHGQFAFLAQRPSRLNLAKAQLRSTIILFFYTELLPQSPGNFRAQARKFYEAEALRGGWSVQQLDRQIKIAQLFVR
jgi:hypothetical protein